MINLKIIFLCFFAFFINENVAVAQKTTKELNKRTKKELKKFRKNPESYRKMIRDHKDEVDFLASELEVLRKEYDKTNYLKSLYYDSLIVLSKQLESMSSESGPVNIDDLKIDYRVQIGAYKLFDITKLLEYDQPIGYGKDEDLIYYYFGSWESAKEAYRYTEIIRENDVEDAFVVKFINGEKVPYDYFKDPNIE